MLGGAKGADVLGHYARDALHMPVTDIDVVRRMDALNRMCLSEVWGLSGQYRNQRVYGVRRDLIKLDGI
jgi:hypothetical protein